jgi:hypothetical protein
MEVSGVGLWLPNETREPVTTTEFISCVAVGCCSDCACAGAPTTRAPTPASADTKPSEVVLVQSLWEILDNAMAIVLREITDERSRTWRVADFHASTVLLRLTLCMTISPVFRLLRQPIIFLLACLKAPRAELDFVRNGLATRCATSSGRPLHVVSNSFLIEG